MSWTPRSPHDEAGGLVWLPRLIDKARRSALGRASGADLLNGYLYGNSDFIDGQVLPAQPHHQVSVQRRDDADRLSRIPARRTAAFARRRPYSFAEGWIMTVDATIENLLRAFESAWASRDGANIARLFAPNAVFTAPTFERSVGRDAIARSEQHALDTYFRDTQVALAIEQITPVRDDVVIVHTTNRVIRDQATVVESHAMFVAEETAGQWSIAGWHNLVALQGAPPP